MQLVESDPGLECPCIHGVSAGVQGTMRVQARPELNQLVSEEVNQPGARGVPRGWNTRESATEDQGKKYTCFFPTPQ